MKDQYFGDQTDYIKHGILRGMLASGIPLGIHWTLTPDDLSTDGSRVSYLQKPSSWRHYDPVLFDVLHASVSRDRRSLRVLSDHGLLDGAEQCFDRWTSDVHLRAQSLDALLSRLSSGALVFLDPDNGMEVQSVRAGTTAAFRYVYMQEVERVWHRGMSLLIYQHFPRVERNKFVESRLSDLMTVAPNAGSVAVTTSRVAFLCLMQPSAYQWIECALNDITKHWAPHLKLVSFGCKRGNRSVPFEHEHRAVQVELSL